MTNGDDQRTDASNEPQPSPSSVEAFFRELRPGYVLADRYEVRSLLGEGAMGVVLEVFDRVVERPEALKLIRPKGSEDETTVARFYRELSVARLVTHPNVCRLYDLGKHPLAGGKELNFLTMELVRGEDLASLIDDLAPMSEAQTLPILRQIVAGLDAAHQAGVVHRDFKAGNVILAPLDDGGQRVVITDFGLSRQLSEDAPRRRLTLTGQVLGTPAYVAPEQLAAKPVSSATDIYALGVLLYQMRTGTLPFDGPTPLAAALERMKRDPTPPRFRHAGVEEAWDAAILRCLARQPEDRFGSVLELLEAIEGSAAAVPGESPDSITAQSVEVEALPSPSPPSRRRLSWKLLLAALGVMMGLALVLARLGPSGPESEPATTPASLPTRPVVAALGFTNALDSKSGEWLSTALPEMLAAELSAATELRVLSRDLVDRRWLELSTADAEPMPSPDLGRALGADFLLRGGVSWRGPPEEIQLTVDLISTADGTAVVSLDRRFAEADLIDVTHEVGDRFRLALGTSPLGAERHRGLRAELPSTVDLARLYALGVAHLRRFDALAARDTLLQAAAADPSHALTRSALAAAWRHLGYDDRSRQEAEAAWEQRQGLPREGQLLIEGRYHGMTGQWELAAESFGALQQFFPDEPDYALLLLDAQRRAGAGNRALRTLATLRAIDPDRIDPRIDLAEAEAALAAGDIKRAHDAATRAVAGARDLTAGLLEARALLAQARTARGLGRPEEAELAASAAESIYRAVGDQGGVAESRLQLGITRRRQGRYEDARARQQEAMEIFRRLGNQGGIARVRIAIADIDRSAGSMSDARLGYLSAQARFEELGNRPGLYVALRNLAILDSIEGNIGSAASSFEQALVVARQAGDRTSEAAALNNLAIVSSDLGDLSRAEALYDDALTLFRQIGHYDGTASALNNIGILRWDQGKLDAAERSYRDAVALAGQAEDPSSLALYRANLAEILLARDELDQAGALYQQAAQDHDDLGEASAAAKTRAYMALVEIERGDPGSAVEPARAAAVALTGQGVPDDEALALVVLARATLESGDLESAGEAILQAVDRSTARSNPAVAVWVDLQRAAVQSAHGQNDEAIATSRRALTTAEEIGLIRLVLEARLALGRALLAAEDTTEGRSLLLAVEAEARRLGFALTARHAAEAIGD